MAATTDSPTSLSLQLCLKIDDETKGWVLFCNTFITRLGEGSARCWSPKAPQGMDTCIPHACHPSPSLFCCQGIPTAPHTPAAPPPQAHHFISGTGTFALESVELAPVVDGDEQLPESQQDDANQHHAANHCQHDGHSTGG